MRACFPPFSNSFPLPSSLLRGMARSRLSLRVACAALVLLAVLCMSWSPLGVDAICTDAVALNSSDVVNIAILVWLIDEPTGLFVGDISDTTATSVAGYGTSIIQPYMLGIDLYVKLMREKQNNVLPLPTGESVNLNFVYINLAGANGTATFADYSKVYASNNVPTFVITTTYSGTGYSAFDTGLMADVLSQNTTVLKDKFNITQPFTFVVPPSLFLDTPTVTLVNQVEDAQSHVIVVPFATSRELFVCDGLAAVNSTTPDCLSTKYNRNRRSGARRFQTMFSTMFDSTANQYAALESFHTMGVTSTVIIADAHSTSSTFSYWASEMAQAEAEVYNIDVLLTYTLTDLTSAVCTSSSAPSNCPPVSLGGLYASQTQAFPDGKTVYDVAAEIKASGAESVIILAAASTGGAWTIGQLFTAFKAVDYMPETISWGGGVDSGITSWMDDPTDIYFTWSTKPWDPQLKGSDYANVLSDTQFDLLPANSTVDGPTMFYNAFEAAYGPYSGSGAGGVGAHPFYTSTWTAGCQPAIAWGTMMIVQKMIETGDTLEVPSLLDSAKSISTPAVYHLLQFDQYGRTSRVNEVLLQKTSGTATIISPYYLEVTPVFPLPTWEQRIFDPIFYSEANEKAMLAINSFCIFLCVLLIGVVLWNWKSAVIRAATPSFCLLIIFGGIMMLISNYFATLVVDDAHCAASTWFLTLGFTTVFSAMFTKTFRIWRIFGRTKLQVLKMKDSDLLLAVGFFLLSDILINAVWMGTEGMDAIEVVVDVNRPSFNYMTCHFGPALGAIYAHLAVKGLLLLCGIFLTWAVRNTPSQFNESTLIGLSIYNVSFVVCFIIPIISSQLGGRHTVYLIRAYAIMFVTLTTLGLLYVPKLFLLADANAVMRTGTSGRMAPKSGMGTRIISGTSGEHSTPAPKSGPTRTGTGTGLGINGQEAGVQMSPVSLRREQYNNQHGGGGGGSLGTIGTTTITVGSLMANNNNANGNANTTNMTIRTMSGGGGGGGSPKDSGNSSPEQHLLQDVDDSTIPDDAGRKYVILEPSTPFGDDTINTPTADHV